MILRRLGSGICGFGGSKITCAARRQFISRRPYLLFNVFFEFVLEYVLKFLLSRVLVMGM